MEKLKVYCPYSSLDLGWKTIKELTNISFDKPWYLEYNTDTSALPPINRSEDIVRTVCITKKDTEIYDKEHI